MKQFFYKKPSTTPKPSNNPQNAFDLNRQLALRLERAGVTYAIGGALAQNQYGDFRLTLDVDLNVNEVELSVNGGLLNALEEFYVVNYDYENEVFLDAWNKESAQAEMIKRGHLIVGAPFRRPDGRLDHVKLEIFPSCLAIQRAIFEGPRATRKIKHETGKCCYLSPEAIIVVKLMFYRAKDRTDIAGILRTMKKRGQALDQQLLDKLIQCLLANATSVFTENTGVMVSSQDKADCFCLSKQSTEI